MNHAKKGITQLDFDLAKKLMSLFYGTPRRKGLVLKGLQMTQDLHMLKQKIKKPIIIL